MPVNKNTLTIKGKNNFESDVRHLIEALYLRLQENCSPIELAFDSDGFSVNGKIQEDFTQKDVLTSDLMQDAFDQWKNSDMPIDPNDKAELQELINNLSDTSKDFQTSRNAFMRWTFSPSLFVQDSFLGYSA